MSGKPADTLITWNALAKIPPDRIIETFDKARNIEMGLPGYGEGQRDSAMWFIEMSPFPIESFPGSILGELRGLHQGLSIPFVWSLG